MREFLINVILGFKTRFKLTVELPKCDQKKSCRGGGKRQSANRGEKSCSLVLWGLQSHICSTAGTVCDLVPCSQWRVLETNVSQPERWCSARHKRSIGGHSIPPTLLGKVTSGRIKVVTIAININRTLLEQSCICQNRNSKLRTVIVLWNIYWKL